MIGWQPIHTAPKNGQRILAWSKDWSEVTIVQWICIHQWDNPDDVYGWAEDADWTTSVNPSYWMPLPPTPQTYED